MHPLPLNCHYVEHLKICIPCYNDLEEEEIKIFLDFFLLHIFQQDGVLLFFHNFVPNTLNSKKNLETFWLVCEIKEISIEL